MKITLTLMLLMLTMTVFCDEYSNVSTKLIFIL